MVIQDWETANEQVTLCSKQGLFIPKRRGKLESRVKSCLTYVFLIFNFYFPLLPNILCALFWLTCTCYSLCICVRAED